MKEIDKAIEKIRKAMSLIWGGYEPKAYDRNIDYSLGDYIKKYPLKDKEDLRKEWKNK